MSFYGVKKGRETGVFENWNDTKASIDNFIGAKFKKFKTKEEAYDFINDVKVIKSDLCKNIPTDCIKVFTDGSCIKVNLDKPHPITKKKYRSLAGYSVYFGPGSDLNYANYLLKDQTNQLAELLAIKEAFEITKKMKEPIVIFTDSMYSINCVTRWFGGWEKNGFMTSTGKPVKHLETIKRIRKLYIRSKGRIQFVHINSHQPKPNCNENDTEYIIWFGNHEADRFASLAAKKSNEII